VRYPPALPQRTRIAPRDLRRGWFFCACGMPGWGGWFGVGGGFYFCDTCCLLRMGGFISCEGSRFRFGEVSLIGSSCSISGMPLWLDPKGRKDQGGEEIGYLRSISAKIFELAPSLRSVAQTAKIFVRSDPAPVEPPISSRPVVSDSGDVSARCVVCPHNPCAGHIAVGVNCRGGQCDWPQRRQGGRLRQRRSTRPFRRGVVRA
jgi:hypothetical protein